MTKFSQLIPILIALFLIGTSLGFLEVNLSHAKVMNEEPNDYVDIYLARVKKINKTHHATVANFTLKKELDNTYRIGCYSYKKSGNMYKLMPYKIEGQFCDLMKSDIYFYPEMKKVTNFPDLDTCPWPPGNYYVNNYIPDLSKIPPVLESGDYMIECKVFDKDGKFLNGLQTYGQMIFLPSVAG